ncbi:MAG: type IV secretory system conjugative DNA transfer family protein [Acidimicrobiales bacterium]
MVAVAAIGLTGLNYATAWLSAFMFGEHHFDANFGDSFPALFQMPRNLADPRHAWKGRAVDQLPGPWLYWGTAVAVTAAVLFLYLTISKRIHGRDRGVDERVRFGVSTQARQAKTADLSSLIVRQPEPGRLLIARHRRKLLATETNRAAPTNRRERRGLRRRGDRGSVIHIGPSRCGKTTSVIAGALAWDGPAILSSVKSDLLDATLAARAEMGEVRIFDPTGSCGRGTARWSPLRDAAQPAGALRAAAAIIAATPKDGVTDGGFWHIQAEHYLTALLLTAALTGRTMSEIAGWALKGDQPTEGNPGQIEPLLRAVSADPDPSRRAAAQRANDLLRGVWGADSKIRDSVYATTRNLMRAWIDPTVGDACAGCEIDLDWLCSGNNTLYICAPLIDQDRLAPVLGGLISDLVNQAYDRHLRTNQLLDPALLLVLDEAGNTPLANLPQWASTIAGLGIQLVTVWQSKAQIDETYGRQSDTILTNHHTKLIYAGSSDQSTVDFASRTLGDEFVAALLDEDRGGHRHGDRGRSVTPVRLGPPHLFRQMRPGTAVLIHGTLPPASVRTLAPRRAGR